MLCHSHSYTCPTQTLHRHDYDGAALLSDASHSKSPSELSWDIGVACTASMVEAMIGSVVVVVVVKSLAVVGPEADKRLGTWCCTWR